MQLLSGHNLGISFAARELFSGAQFGVEQNAHIGLVGANGSGKTTLFRLIAGELKPDQGQIVFSREARLAYMEQFLAAGERQTLYDAALAAFAPLLAIESRLEAVNRGLTQGGNPALLVEQARLQEEYAAQGGYTYRGRLRSTLLGLGFQPDDLQLPIAALSGGQRSKAALAKVLLQDANLMLLDEPTNHLDIDSIVWLEQFLAGYRNAFIVISHDRYFLDRVTTETWDLHHGGLHCYPGNYSAHLTARESAEEAAERRYAHQLREIRRLHGVIEQQRRWNQARNYITIASKQKQIARLERELVRPDQAEQELSFSFSVPPPGGNEVLELHGLAKSFGKKRLFEHADLSVRRGERVFLLGPNGSGKTTLMRIISGGLEPDAGSCRLGVNILPAYYDQIHGHIRGQGSILAHFTEAYPLLTQTKIRSMLANFLFPGDSVEQSVAALSGGERARLELLKLILEPANFLLLDEPTNHLDIISREAVERALLAYPGAMLVVSHDRYLINKLADRIYYLRPEGLIESIGDYDGLLHTLEKLRQAEEPLPEAEAAGADANSRAGGDYRRRKQEQAEERRLKRRREELAARIAALEDALVSLEQEMHRPELADDYQRLMALQAEKEAAEAELLADLEQLEQIEAELCSAE